MCSRSKCHSERSGATRSGRVTSGGRESDDLKRAICDELRAIASKLEDSESIDLRELLGTVHHGDRQFLLLLVSWKASTSTLTRREREIAQLVGRGLGNKGIGKELGIHEGTVANHLKNINRKLGIHSRAMLVRLAHFLIS